MEVGSIGTDAAWRINWISLGLISRATLRPLVGKAGSWIRKGADRGMRDLRVNASRWLGGSFFLRVTCESEMPALCIGGILGIKGSIAEEFDSLRRGPLVVFPFS